MDDECDDDDGVEDEARLGDVVRPPNPPPHQPPPRVKHPPHPPMTKPTKSKQIFVWPSTSLCIDRTALTYYRHADTRTRISQMQMHLHPNRLSGCTQKSTPIHTLCCSPSCQVQNCMLCTFSFQFSPLFFSFDVFSKIKQKLKSNTFSILYFFFIGPK